MEISLAELQVLEEVVRKSDGNSIRARWESGRYLLSLKNGKKLLPKGKLDELAKALDVARSELGARMTFAMKFPTEVELSDVIRKHLTWYDITHTSAVTKKRQCLQTVKNGTEDPTFVANLKRVVNILENLDSAHCGENGIVLVNQIDFIIRRLRAAIVTLREELPVEEVA